MKISKEAKKMAEDLGLTEADAVIMDLKSKLYSQASKAIKNSKISHERIAEKLGTSRARVTRISNMGESSVSIELLVRIIVTLNKKNPIQLKAA